MSTLSGLLSSSGGSGVTPPPPPPPPSTPLVIGPGDYVHFDGNSITNDFQAFGLDALVSERLAGNGASFSVLGGTGVNGHTWLDLFNSHRPSVAAAFDSSPATRKFLVVGETTNSIFVGGRTAAQTIADARKTLAAYRSDRDWNGVIIWGSIPRGHGNETTYPGEAAKNAAMIEVDSYMAANFLDMGAAGFVSARSGVPMFDHNGTSSTAFSAYQSAWNEAPPSTAGWGENLLGWCHPKDGTFPSGSTPGTGKRAIAARIASALTDGSISV